MEKKITKREKYEAMIVALEKGEFGAVTKEDMIELCKNEIALLDKKSNKAKERAAEKRAEADELGEVVKSVMSNEEFETIADITAKVVEAYGEEATVSKVRYRLTQLINAGLAENTDVKIPGGEGQKTRTIKAYRLLNA